MIIIAQNIFGIEFICYRPQTKFAKVMFLHLSVILFKGECVVEGRAWQGGHVWQGACMAAGGMHGRGVCMAGGVRGRGHACRACPPPDTRRYSRSVHG